MDALSQKELFMFLVFMIWREVVILTPEALGGDVLLEIGKVNLTG
jgi:hypothetical protein